MSPRHQHSQTLDRPPEDDALELAEFLEGAAVGLCWLKPDGTVCWANRAQLELLGYSAQEYVGRRIHDTYQFPEEAEALLGQLRNRLKVHNQEVQLKTRTGQVRYGLVSATGYWENDTLTNCRCFIRDITDRVQREKLLRRSHRVLEQRIAVRTEELSRVEAELEAREQLLGAITQNAHDAIVTSDAQGNVSYLNPAAERLFGVEGPLDSLRLDTLIPGFHPAHHHWGGGILESVARRHDGRLFPVELSVSAWQSGAAVLVTAIVRDISDRRSADEHRRLLASIVESSDDAIIAYGLDGRVLSWNSAAQAIYGYTPQEAVGMPVSRLVPPDRAHELAGFIAHIARGDRVDHHETVRVRKDGRQVDVSLSISPLRDAAGRVYGASAIARDITERKRAAETRLRLLEEHSVRSAAEEAIRARDEFLSVASHELKTPLTAIKLQIQSILGTGLAHVPGGLRAGLDGRLSKIDAQANRLSRLVNSLLEVTRLTAHKVDVSLEEVNLAEVVRESTQRAQEPMAKAGCLLILRAQPGVTGWWDPLRLDQVVDHLLSNAIKYGPGKPVEVSVEGNSRQATLVVRDHGIGVAAHDQERIFGRFERAVSVRQFGGLGLGLWITRQVVEAMGGSITVHSQPGEGATFRVVLPRKPPKARARRPRPAIHG